MRGKEAKQLIGALTRHTERKGGFGEDVIVTVYQQKMAIAFDVMVSGSSTTLSGLYNPGQPYPGMWPRLPGLDGPVS